MQSGIRYKAYPTAEQAEVLSQWIGCARVIWNAKCDEDRYLRTLARHCLPIKIYPKPDKSYSQFKTELTPLAERLSVPDSSQQCRHLGEHLLQVFQERMWPSSS